MPIFLSLQDTFYPFTYTDHVRDIARAFIVDENNNVAIHMLHRNDMFGNQRYYETPGGGVDENETFERAVIRECEEETGYKVGILAYIGEVDDFYNLIHRENHNRFYLCKRKEFLRKHFESSGDMFIEKTIWVPFPKLIEFYQNQEDFGVAGIVRQRELPMAIEAYRLLKEL